MRTHSSLTRNAGFTLVEMLVAVALAGVVGMAALTVFTSATRTTTAQTELTQEQQNLRAAMDRLTQHARVAGFGLPERQSFSLTFGLDTFTRPVTVTNGGNLAPDTLTLVGIGREAGLLNGFQANGCNINGATCLSLTSNADFITAGVFNPLRRYISLGGAAFLQVSGVVGNNVITLTAPLSGFPPTYFQVTPQPAVFILQALQYSIATNLTGCSGLQPCLAVQDFTQFGGNDRQVLAQGIEDLQIGVFLGTGGAAFISDPTALEGESANLSAMRISLVGRSENADRSGSIFQRPALEDRAAGATDTFRRRVMTTVVKIRNPRTSS